MVNFWAKKLSTEILNNLSTKNLWSMKPANISTIYKSFSLWQAQNPAKSQNYLLVFIPIDSSFNLFSHGIKIS